MDRNKLVCLFLRAWESNCNVIYLWPYFYGKFLDLLGCNAISRMNKILPNILNGRSSLYTSHYHNTIKFRLLLLIIHRSIIQIIPVTLAPSATVLFLFFPVKRSAKDASMRIWTTGLVSVKICIGWPNMKPLFSIVSSPTGLSYIIVCQLSWSIHRLCQILQRDIAKV